MKASRRAITIAAFATALPAAGLASGLSLRSDLPAYRVTMLEVLPSAPQDAEQECRSAPPRSAAGKAVAAAGWQVISDVPLGGHTLVTFAPTSSMGAEGVCEYTGGNLGVFEADRLLGLYWSPEAETIDFGPLSARSEGVVDLHPATFPVVPMAQIVLQGGEILLQARPAVLSECGGQAQVPQLYHHPIGQMRESLIALGWTAMAAPAAQEPNTAYMHAHGFPETESCSGTGVNYCSFTYLAPQARLVVTTVGELGPDHQPTMVDYELTCLKGPQ